MNVNLIRDSENAFWVHDVNLRAWGTIGAFTNAGMDFFSAYICWLRRQPVPAIHTKASSPIEWIDSYPAALRGANTKYYPTRLAAYWRQELYFGARYLAATLARNARHLIPTR